MSPYKDEEKQREYQKQWYQRNKEKVFSQSKKRKDTRREYVRNIKKNSECIKCGEDRWYVLDFHHKDSDEKERSISELTSSYGLYKIKEEIKKCIILCSNCHREIHYLKQA